MYLPITSALEKNWQTHEVPITFPLFVEKIWAIYSKIIGLWFPDSGEGGLHKLYISHANNFVNKQTWAIIADRLPRPQNTRFDLIQHIIADQFDHVGEKQWSLYLKFLPILSRITILSRQQYGIIYKVAIKDRPLLILNGYSLQPCAECHQLCYPPAPCDEKCKYVGIHICEDCIGVTDTSDACASCFQSEHTKCIEVKELCEESRRLAKITCKVCIYNVNNVEDLNDYDDHPNNADNKYHCISCLRLYQCYESDCKESTCNRHALQCSKCEEYGCVFHIICIPDIGYQRSSEDVTHLCQPCYRMLTIVKSSPILSTSTLTSAKTMNDKVDGDNDNDKVDAV